MEELTGFRTIGGERLFYIARPMAVGSDSCLECHGDPTDAPASLRATYGEGGGFGWELGEVVAAQVVYVPADDVLNQGRTLFAVVIITFAAIFAITLLLINRLMTPTVVQPVEQMAGLAQKIADDKLDDEALDPDYLAQVMARGDELGRMVVVFNQMVQEVAQREQALKSELQQLRIEINQTRRERELKQITETEYFQNLQARASDLRRRFGQQGGPAPNPASGD